jgi:hypothetical protein
VRLAEALPAAGDTGAVPLLERVAAEAPGFGLNRLAERAAVLGAPVA